MGVLAEEVQVPFGGPKGNLVRESDWARVSAAGHELWSVEEYPVRHLQSLLEKYLADFIGYQEVHVLIGEQCPDLLEAILKNQGGVSALTRVLRALLAEQVPVTEFRKIVEHYLKLSQAGTRPLDIVESIRGLAGIVELLPGNEPAARRSSIASKFSSVIEKGIQSTSGIPVLALEPELCQEMLTAVRQSIAAHSPTALLLEDQKLRPFARELVKLEFPDLAVLSRSELNPAAAPPVGQVEVAS
jgi:flagellar biosynthesis protein FlhA